ncbi:protein of unknown function [Pseudomonas linyingensis]|uniref:Protein NO VEIN C-terminal domain-containing protein n=1 Tax=Pseudomonas linyingensis TaxID=915471 RepID=A0A1H6Y858_9PSED|nr:DUF3883 domain-containing protein [Pseudomonas linyingensis]SEJ33310.1 protein of unknown function [Pseudomonas linyingensis]
MDITTQIIETIKSGQAIKVCGNIEHWLTTLATGFWGFDTDKQDFWGKLKPGDVFIFQASRPNLTFVTKSKPSPDASGFIGAGIVGSTSRKTEPRWLSEVIESNFNESPRIWPNLVHFSDVLWFGDVDQIPAQAVQEAIERCKERQLDLNVHIHHLARNRLTLKEMANKGFTYAPASNGQRLLNKTDKLADIFKSHATSATRRSYYLPEPLELPITPPPLDASDYVCIGNSSPTRRMARPSTKSASRKGATRSKDYLQEAAANQALGRLGEKIVLKREIERVSVELGEENKFRVVDVPHVEGDGAGYDIRSVRLTQDGISIYFIEVKTTTGDANTPFFLTENERNFAALNAEQLEVVRIHSLDQSKGEYQEYRLTGSQLLNMVMTPITYRVEVGIEPAAQGDLNSE